jgi:hypothetical protein
LIGLALQIFPFFPEKKTNEKLGLCAGKHTAECVISTDQMTPIRGIAKQ